MKNFKLTLISIFCLLSFIGCASSSENIKAPGFENFNDSWTHEVRNDDNKEFEFMWDAYKGTQIANRQIIFINEEGKHVFQIMVNTNASEHWDVLGIYIFPETGDARNLSVISSILNNSNVKLSEIDGAILDESIPDEELILAKESSLKILFGIDAKLESSKPIVDNTQAETPQIKNPKPTKDNNQDEVSKPKTPKPEISKPIVEETLTQSEKEAITRPFGEDYGGYTWSTSVSPISYLFFNDQLFTSVADAAGVIVITPVAGGEAIATLDINDNNKLVRIEVIGTLASFTSAIQIKNQLSSSIVKLIMANGDVINLDNNANLSKLFETVANVIIDYFPGY